MRTRVKICGITNPEDAVAAVACGADAIGFVFVEESPRFIEPEYAAEIMYALPPFVTAVGVVRDLDVDAYCALEQRCPAPIMQLHGKEPVDVVKQCGPGVIKAFKHEDVTIDSQLKRWHDVNEVDALLIDGGDGGEGVAFDWSSLASKLEAYPIPVMVAGGVTHENVGELIGVLNPYAVDASSSVEEKPGLKDHDAIARLCEAVRRADLGV